MRLIKLAVISAIVLFGIITIIASFIPSTIRISRALDIAAPRSKIYGQLADIRGWEAWNMYVKSYHNRQVEQQQLVADEMRIGISQLSDTLITTTWTNASGKNFNSGYAIIQHDSLHYTVQWYFDFHLKWYPWEKFQGIVYDQQFGPVMEQSLKELKKNAENHR